MTERARMADKYRPLALSEILFLHLPEGTQDKAATMISWDNWKPRTDAIGKRVEGQDTLCGVLMTGTTAAWKISVHKGGLLKNVGINISRGEEYSGDEQDFSKILNGVADKISDDAIKSAVVEFMREILTMIIERAEREMQEIGK